MKKILSAGAGKSNKKAPDKKGEYIDVQKRTLGNLKCGGKLKKKGK